MNPTHINAKVGPDYVGELTPIGGDIYELNERVQGEQRRYRLDGATAASWYDHPHATPFEESKRERAAAIEASHAVMCALNGLPVKGVALHYDIDHLEGAVARDATAVVRAHLVEHGGISAKDVRRLVAGARRGIFSDYETTPGSPREARLS